MLHRIFLAGRLATLLALGACGSSGGSSGGDSVPDTSAFAGLWDAGEIRADGLSDERYVAISADGRYTEYDYRQDGTASDGNCYLVTELSLRSIGTRDEQPVAPSAEPAIDADGSLTDADPIVFSGEVRAYRLDDGRTVSFVVNPGFDEDGSLTDDDFSRTGLTVAFGAGLEARGARYWPAITSLSTEELTPCDGA